MGNIVSDAPGHVLQKLNLYKYFQNVAIDVLKKCKLAF